MGDPFDKAFKLFAEKDEIDLLRVIANLTLPPNARIEHLDRELDLATVHVDQLYRMTVDGHVVAVHFEAFSHYDSDWRRRLARYAALIWAKYGIEVMCFMVFLTDRGVPRELPEEYEILAGDLRLDMRVRIIRMWQIPAKSLLDAGNPALLPWVPLTDATPEEIQQAASGVIHSGDTELRSRMLLLHEMRYSTGEVPELMITDEIIRESAFYKRIRKQCVEEGMVQGQERLFEQQLQVKFGTLPSDVITRLQSASLNDLETWGKRFVKASTLDEVFG